MKKTLLCAAIVGSAFTASAQYASQTFVPSKLTERSLFFSTSAPGQSLPILWGLDTAWPSVENIRRGVRYIGAGNIGVCRVSFQPWDYISSPTLTARLENNLVERLNMVKLIGAPGTVKIVLNNDGPAENVDSRYLNPASSSVAVKAYCDLIYATTLSCQDKGWEVITASPLNEPDYQWNKQGNKADFLAIAKKLKTEYPQYSDGSIRISGGNTLNCDEALPWYTYLFDYIDEGNTHQLAGDFDHYADFFTRVRADGKYATADELHNVMEAMVGVEYGMQTGIWWGTAELARGEFCKASFGERLAYSENRPAWTSAAVYRAPDGQVQAFVGSSERQANNSSYRFVSTDRDVFFNGHGPQREYVVDIPGGSGYQNGQTNAECVVDITWGEDVSPIIDGNYVVMNKFSQKVMAVKGSTGNLAPLKQYSTSTATASLWEVKPVSIRIGGDFSYYTIKLSQSTNMKADVNNWSLEEGGNIILYDGGLGSNEQWYLKYAGDGYFRIFSRHSNLCLQLEQQSSGDGVNIVQASPSDSPTQLWRFMPMNAMCETDAPAAPTNLKATPYSASVRLDWTRSTSTDGITYTVLRAEAGTGEFNTIGRGITGKYFIDNTAAAGKSYDYKVKAVDRAVNTSEASNIVTTEIPTAMSIVGRWIFDGNLTDATENRFDAATATGTNLTYDTGRAEAAKSLKLSSSTFVQLPYQITNYPEYTVCAWVNPLSVSGTSTIFDFSSDYDKFVSLVVKNGSLVLTAQNGDKTAVAEGANLAANKWQHIAVTVAYNKLALYIDGALAAESSALGFNPKEIAPVLNYVGRAHTDQNAPLNALVHDLRAYNYAIGATYIPTLMNPDLNGINDIAIDAEILSTEYYNLAGIKVDTPLPGIYVVVRRYADGRITTAKEVVSF